jgi:hypothetical protein
VRIAGPFREAHPWQHGEPTRRAQVDELHAVGAASRGERRVVTLDLRQLAGQRMATRCGEEVVIAEIHADEADSLGAKMPRQVYRDVGRVVRIVQLVALAALGAAAPAEPKAHDARLRQFELRELREHGSSLRALDFRIAIAIELAALVEDHEVVGREAAADVVDADRQPALGLLEQRKRAAAAADEHARAAVPVAVQREAIGEEVSSGHATAPRERGSAKS